MKHINGFTQDKLNEIWDSLHSENPDDSATKVVDDEIEQVMTIATTQGQTAVSRPPGGDWKETKSVGDNDFAGTTENE